MRLACGPVVMLALTTCSVKSRIFEGVPGDAAVIDDASRGDDPPPIEDALLVGDATPAADALEPIDAPVVDAPVDARAIDASVVDASVDDQLEIPMRAISCSYGSRAATTCIRYWAAIG